MPPSPARPVRVFHGTDAEFEAFDPAQLGTANGRAPSNLAGFHFTDSREVARTFGRTVLECEVRIERPRRMDAHGESYSTFKHRLNTLLYGLDREKYDGLIVRNYADAGLHSDEYLTSTHFIPFHVSQVDIVARHVDLEAEANS